VFFTIALHAQKNSFQGQSQPHENHSPHRGVTKPAAMAQVPTIDALFGSLTRAPLSDQNSGAPLIPHSADERMSMGQIRQENAPRWIDAMRFLDCAAMAVR
jgi:hypothetical protein